ncbi:urea ABC transporter permease subunit UrtB [Methylobacterium sp. BTF04]|nr:urea ABC transporter permease subunit UrtB [Methylobacterium sp. BTF04]
MLMLSATVAAAAGDALDRPGLVAALCGDAAALGRGAEAVIGSAGSAAPDDLAFAGGVLRGLLDRRLACVGTGAVLLDRVGAADGRDVLTGIPASATGGRSPVLGLRQRGLVEAGAGIVALLTGATVEARSAGLATLARRMGTLPEADAILERARTAEADAGLRRAIAQAMQAAALDAPDPARRRAAIAAIAAVPSSAALSRLTSLKADPAYIADPAFRAALDTGIASVERAVAIGNGLALAYNAVSFASILFMAAAGLAIIFGLMGVINLAQGEFIMVGAYAAYGVQEAFRWLAPGLIDLYLIAAIPVAFLASACVGIAVEALILRHLYRRPLMSLLATWAVSLFLINGVRVAFGSQNLQFGMPSYVSGGVPLYADFIVTWNRLFAIAFAAVTLVATLLILKRTPLGLDIRAVTQNRDMAGALGIRTRRVDRLAFGFGSGLAGLAGVALCPIYSVNPGMGANFIVDSFMVVVLGGVGTVVGTLVAALGIGGANVLIEPFYGAVAAKVIVLVGIIVFLQRRPEGLFAARRRR